MRKINDIKYSLRRYETLQGNFTQISNSVLKIIDNCYQFTIYFYLCNMFNRDYGYAFPSIRTIATETHISVKKVQSTLKELEELGLISILKFEEKVFEDGTVRRWYRHPISNDLLVVKHKNDLITEIRFDLDLP